MSTSPGGNDLTFHATTSCRRGVDGVGEDNISTSTMEQTAPASEVVFHVVGEPAVCINGTPELSSSALCSSILPQATDNAKPREDPCLGDWLEGREVQKLFGNRYYYGRVVKFDPEMKWYRVVYEDGDFEDLEWHELEEVLVPLDVSVPLRTLVQQVREYHKFADSLEGKTTESRKPPTENVESISNVPDQL